MGSEMCIRDRSSIDLREVAEPMLAEPAAGPLWFQLYWRDDRSFMRDLLQRVQAVGYQALVLTVDAPVHGARDRERRAGFQLPPHIRAVNLGGLKKPLDLKPGQSALFDGLMPRAATWADVDWLRAETGLPLLLKGVTHVDDAREALARGVSGFIVSNHGGRTLDTLPPTAALLPALRTALGPETLLLVDGGIRRGTDVLKAMALGANAVLLGRPYVHALAASGALGVAHALRLLRDELEIAMALSGCKTLADAGPALFWPGTLR